MSLFFHRRHLFHSAVSPGQVIMEINDSGRMQRLTKNPWRIFWDILKLLDTQSHLPTVTTPQQRWQKCVPMKTPKHHSQPQSSHVCCAFQSINCRNPGPEAQACGPFHCTTATLAENNWHGGTGQIFKSAQQVSAPVGQHIFIAASRGQGSWRNRNSAGNYLLGFPARFSRRPV